MQYMAWRSVEGRSVFGVFVTSDVAAVSRLDDFKYCLGHNKCGNFAIIAIVILQLLLGVILLGLRSD